MRKYTSPLIAVLTRLKYMKANDLLNAEELARRLEHLPPDCRCNGSMIRMLARGDESTLSHDRTMGLCNILNIAVEVTDPHIPSETAAADVTPSTGNVATVNAAHICRQLVSLYEGHAPDVQAWPHEAYRLARQADSVLINYEETREQHRAEALKSLVNWWNGSTADETHPLCQLVKQAGMLTGYGWRVADSIAVTGGVITINAAEAEINRMRSQIASLENANAELRKQYSDATIEIHRLSLDSETNAIAHIVNTLNKTNGNCAVLNMTCGDYAVTVNVRKIVEAAKE